jgi:hypothetical protein
MNPIGRITSFGVALFSFAFAGCGSDDPNQPTIPGESVDTSGGADDRGGITEIATGGEAVVAYPAPPYGTEVGAVIENLKFVGWKQPTAAGYAEGSFETVSMSDFYDPDGTKSIKLILINASAVWCQPCNLEAGHIRDAGLRGTYKAKGVEFIFSLFEDALSNPAKPQDLVNWSTRYEVDYPMVLDPALKLGSYFAYDATPLNLVIDARTMRIVDRLMGGMIDAQTWGFVDDHL